MFYAHSTDDNSRSNWHLLRDHLIGSGEKAAHAASYFSGQKASRLAGLLHDLGKYSPAFQERLLGGSIVDHATAGAAEIKKMVSSPQDKVMAELIAFAIAGHHAGLADRYLGGSALAERLSKTIDPPDPIWRQEITPDASDLMPQFTWNKKELAFQLGVLGRMIFSCLIDADRRDTEAFHCRITGEQRDREWPALRTLLDDWIASFDRHMANKAVGAPSSPLNCLRSDVLNHVRAGASQAPGLFTLTVPTGGGKTLTSLGFALDHAKAHGLRRIIYAIPFTSTIDQTVSIFKEVLGPEFILEHHSAIEQPDADKEQKLRNQTSVSKLRLAMEDWAAPLIVTTNVQLFESLFANRPSRCRKLHNITGSVIILDEAQTLPRHLLRPTMEMLRELARNYGVSVVLCTATQPALDQRDLPGGLPLDGRELAPDPAGLVQALRRTTIRMADRPLSDDDLLDELRGHSQALVIVNSRKHALALFHKAEAAGLDGAIHLTTRQYAAHRREILADVAVRLRNKQSCRLIATSLVEAGVDLDFPRVWRAEAGLDQIAQAAGRCNREGKNPAEDSIVTVFKAADNPPPAEIKQLAADFARIMDRHHDYLTPAAMRDYFGEVYWRLGDRLDAENIVSYFKVNGMEADFAYRTVAEKYRMIEDGMAPVIIAGDPKARNALARLKLDDIRPGAVARDLQPYIVQVPPAYRAKLWQNGHVRFEEEEKYGDQFCVLQTADLYRLKIGLLWEDADYLGQENTII